MKIEISIKNIYLFLAKYLKGILGVILVLLFLLSAFIYYQYIYSVMNIQLDPVVKKISVDQATLQKVLDNLDLREESLARVRVTRYVNPFND